MTTDRQSLTIPQWYDNRHTHLGYIDVMTTCLAAFLIGWTDKVKHWWTWEMMGWQEIAWIRQLLNIWGDGGVAGDCMDMPTPKHIGRWQEIAWIRQLPNIWGDGGGGRRLHGYANSQTYGEVVGWQEIAWICQLPNIWGDGRRLHGYANSQTYGEMVGWQEIAWIRQLPNIWGGGGVAGDCMDMPTPKHMGRWWGGRRLHGYANSQTYGEMVGWQEITWISQLPNIWGDGGVAGDYMDKPTPKHMGRWQEIAWISQLPNIWGDGGVAGDYMDKPTPKHMGRWWGGRRLHG